MRFGLIILGIARWAQGTGATGTPRFQENVPSREVATPQRHPLRLGKARITQGAAKRDAPTRLLHEVVTGGTPRPAAKPHARAHLYLDQRCPRPRNGIAELRCHAKRLCAVVEDHVVCPPFLFTLHRHRRILWP